RFEVISGNEQAAYFVWQRTLSLPKLLVIIHRSSPFIICNGPVYQHSSCRKEGDIIQNFQIKTRNCIQGSFQYAADNLALNKISRLIDVNIINSLFFFLIINKIRPIRFVQFIVNLANKLLVFQLRKYGSKAVNIRKFPQIEYLTFCHKS